MLGRANEERGTSSVVTARLDWEEAESSRTGPRVTSTRGSSSWESASEKQLLWWRTGGAGAQPVRLLCERVAKTMRHSPVRVQLPSLSSSSAFVSAAAKPWQCRKERAVGQHLCSAQCFSPSGGGAEAPQVFPCHLLFGLRDGVRVTLIIVGDFLAAGKWRQAGTSERRARNLVGGDGSSGLGGSRKFAHGPARTLECCLWRMGHCSLR